jgi:hypothetical protein
MIDDALGRRGRAARSARCRPDAAWLPAGSAGPAAADFFVALVRRRGDITDLVSHLLGRPVRSCLLSQQVIGPVRPPGLVRLRTTGPFLHRHVRLDDSLPPHLPVAVLWALIVPWRLPEPVRRALAGGPEPLDRLLVRHSVRWTAEPQETDVHPVTEASTAFPWAAPATPLVEQARVLTAEDTGPVAATIEEIPLLYAGADSAAPLLRRAPSSPPTAVPRIRRR